MIQLRIVPINPPPFDMNVMRCPKRERRGDKEVRCFLYVGHFGECKFDS